MKTCGKEKRFRDFRKKKRLKRRSKIFGGGAALAVVKEIATKIAVEYIKIQAHLQ
jgi:hypothetical protein